MPELLFAIWLIGCISGIPLGMFLGNRVIPWMVDRGYFPGLPSLAQRRHRRRHGGQ